MAFMSRKASKGIKLPRGFKENKQPAVPVNNNRSDKGLKNGSCNVTACQRPNSAVYFNKSTRAYYCKQCAEQINWPGGRADVMNLYGVPLLCELDDEM